MTTNPFDSEFDAPAGAGIDLASFDEDFAEAEAPDFDEVPDGKYQATINKAQLTTSRNGNPMIKWDLIVISGKYEGRHIFKNAVITRASMPFIKGDLTKVGLQLGKISELPNHLPDLLDKKVEVTVRTKGEFTNVYFNRLLLVPSGQSDPVDIPW